jgi:hypothetical protein
MKYDWLYNDRLCVLLWKQRQYDTALVQFEDGSEVVVPYSQLKVNKNLAS